MPILIQPEERTRISLDQYFRGSLLSYELDVKPLNDTVNYDGSLISVTNPIQITHEYDFPQFQGQQSLPQHTVIYKDRYNSIYLIFIDFTMNLQIYNISNYMYESERKEAISLISSTDIYKNKDLSPERSCTNLIILEENRLLANCKSNYQIKKSFENPSLKSNLDSDQEISGVSVIIDIINMKKPEIRFFVNGDDFLSMKDGEYRFFKKINFTYLILVKKYKTNCYFNVESMDGFLKPNIVRQIYTFDNPVSIDSLEYQSQLSEKYLNLNPLREDGICKQTQMIDRYSNTIEYMQIQDIEILHQYDNIIVASDYNFGILFMNITCPNVTYCYYKPHFQIQEHGLGKIYVMDNEAELSYQVMFVQKLSPPGILEINLQNVNSPFIQRSYYLADDDGTYITIDILAANIKYIITNYMSLQDMKPVMRIIKRDALHFSIGYAEYKFLDFFDSGLYINFMNPFQDFFLLKTSDVFRIVKLQSVDLIIDGSNSKHIQEMNLLDHTLSINMKVYDTQRNLIQTQLEVKIISQENSYRTYGKYIGSRDDKTFNVQFSCGSDSTEQINFREYFNGPLTTYDLIPLNESEYHYFELVQETQGQARVYTYSVPNCYLPGILNLKSFASNTEQTILACMLYLQDRVTIIDAFAERPDMTALPIYDFIIPEGSIVEFDSDPEQDVFFVLSNRTSEGQSGAVIHFFKQYNRFQWEDSIDLNKEFPELEGSYRFRSFNSITYDLNIKEGVFCSEPQYIHGNLVYKQIIFGLTYTITGYQMFIKSILVTQIPLDENGHASVTIISTKINSLGLWVIFSNNTLNLYEPVEIGFHSQGFKSQNPNFTMASILKKAFYFIEGDFKGNALHNFRSIGNMFVLFHGEDQVSLQRYYQRSYEFKDIMNLPLYQGQDLNKDKIQYKFTYNSFLQIVDSDVYEQVIFFVCSKYENKKFITYTIFGFDVTKNRHETLQVRQDLNISLLQLDQKYFNIRVVEGTKNYVRLILSLSKDFMLIYEYSINSGLILKNDSSIQNNFVDLCKKQDMMLSYSIYPKDDPTENIIVNIQVQNNGKVIYLDQNETQITISKNPTSSKLQQENINGRYSLLSNIHGQDVHYSLTCLRQNIKEVMEQSDITVSQETIISQYKTECSNIELSSRIKAFYQSLEFLGSSIQLLGFYVLDPVMIFFDRKYINLIVPSQHETLKYEVESIFKGFLPHQFFMKPIFMDGEIAFYLLLCQDTTLKVQLTYAYTKAQADEYLLNQDMKNFLNMENQLFIYKHQSFTKIYLNISQCEFYVENSDASKILGIFSHDLEFVDVNSKLSFYWIIKQNDTIKYEYVDEHSISVYSLEINSLKINSMGVNKNQPILYLGIQNFGIVFLNLKTFKIIKMESLQSQVSKMNFEISQIIFESQNSIFIAINNNGLISMHYDFKALYFNDLKLEPLKNAFDNQTFINELFKQDQIKIPDPVFVNHVKYDQDVQIVGNNWLAKSPHGFAYLEKKQDKLELSQQTFYYRLRFISYYAMEDSKSLGTVDIEQDDDCLFLQTIPTALAKQFYLPEITGNDFFVVASVCSGTELKLVAFNFHPQIIVKMPSSNTQIEYSQTIQIDVKSQEKSNSSLNIFEQIDEFRVLEEETGHDQLEGFISRLILQINVINQERKIEVIYYLIYIAAIGFIIGMLNWLVRNIDHKQKQPRKSIDNKRKSISQIKVTNNFRDRQLDYLIQQIIKLSILKAKTNHQTQVIKTLLIK
eukprot:403336815